MTAVAVAFTPQSARAEMYYRALSVTLASVRRWHPGLRTVLVTDTEPPPYVREFAEVRFTAFRHRPPEGFVTEPMRGCLYTLDALDALAGDDTLLVDPDVLCTAPLDGLFARAGDKLGAYPLEVAPEHDIYGQTRAGAAVLHQLLGTDGALPPLHYGGECYWIPAGRAPELRHATDRAWRLSLSRHARGETWLPTEEHLLGYGLNTRPVVDLSPYVRRVWTASRYRTVDGSEHTLPLWHLPAEKNRGFQTLYAAVVDRSSWFWSTRRAEFVARAGRVLSVTGRTPGKLVRDGLGQAVQLMAAAR
ncbi:hypothetical protein ACFQVC_16290 [Streptomyces monticola]|uniref:Glycosyltransferase family 2 protein n=1 Tax=Streptomyces monticola TaxID=2666263 RepID=A0ABW2JJG5_9ACTN